MSGADNAIPVLQALEYAATGRYPMVDATELDATELDAEERARVIAGRYEIVERIGAGAMGQVLRVRHRRLRKSFALKLMQPEFSIDPEARRVFHREARLASVLSHPNIVSVVDFGEDPDWGLFIVMDLVEGEPLSRRVERGGRLSVETACTVAIQLARALQHSHAHDVVHGDLKPDNVLCVDGPEQAAWQVKLLDFGTAEIASRARQREKCVAGTPEYMAPERIIGGAPSPAVDIYSLGIVLYEMLAGSTPFCGDDPNQVLQRHLEAAPEPVGARRGEVLDEELVRILGKTLDKEPSQRYQRADELLSDLCSYVERIGVRQRELEQRVGLIEHSREEAAADAFDALGIAVAGLDADGTARVANRVFARLLGAASPDQVEGRNVVDTVLGGLHPGMREDLRLVAMRGKLVRRELRIPLGDAGATLSLRLVMTPASGRCGPCVVVIDTPDGGSRR